MVKIGELKMATMEQVNEIVSNFKDIRPIKFFSKIDGVNAGKRFVLGYLSENNGEIYASSLSGIMNISRARISIMLDNLIQKGCITKKISSTDARKEVISITSLGLEEAKRDKREINDTLIKVIDTVGYDRIAEFVNIAKQIKEVLND